MNTFRMTIALAAASTLAGCGGGSSGSLGPAPQPVVITSITISPTSAVLAIGDTVSLSATARRATGQTVTGVTFVWSADDDSVASVSNSGVVEAIGIGRTPIRARVGSVEGSINVDVQAAPAPAVASVEIQPTQAVLTEGQSMEFDAIARDANGGVITGRGEQWTAGDSSVVFVEPLGRSTGLRPGATTVQVRIDGQTATAALRVEANYPFSLLYSAADASGIHELYTLDISDAAASPVALVAGVAAGDPTPSPDGTAFAYSVITGNDSHIFRANRDGTGTVQLTAGAGLRDQPAWSPDGSRIAFRERIGGQGTDIWTINAADGTAAQNLTADLGATSQSSPAWSPVMIGGSYRIAFSHAASGQGHIWTMRDDGSDKQQLTSSTTAYDDQPDWSPNGARIVFQRSSSSIFGDIYWVDATAGGAGAPLMPVIGPLAGPQFAPAWSPDGQLVAFTSRHNTAEFQVFTVWADGTRLAQRTFSGEHAGPAWIND